MKTQPEEFKDLFDVALRIKELEPWEELWDQDLICVVLPNASEPLFFSILGHGKECYGICCYVGEGALSSLTEMCECDDDDALYTQDALVLYFGDRDELDKDDYDIIKQLGYKFRGRNNWPYFRAFVPGYFPRPLSSDETGLLTEGYKNLFMALRAILEKGQEVDFEGGDILLRHYDEKQKLWLNHPIPFKWPEPYYPEVTVNNRAIVDELKNAGCNSKRMEMDIFYLPIPMKDEAVNAPYYPRMIMLAESKSGMVVSAEMFKPNENIIEKCLDAIFDYICRFGKPSSISIRSDYLQAVVSNFCTDIGLKCNRVKNLPAVNAAKIELLKKFSR